MEVRVKTEPNLATQAVYEHLLYLFASFTFFYLLVLLLSIHFVLKYNKYHIL